MSKVSVAYVPPSIDRRSFNCPHCMALAQQFWFTLHAIAMDDGETPPLVDQTIDLNSKSYQLFLSEIQPGDRKSTDRYVRRMLRKKPFLGGNNYSSAFELHCINFSRCFHCKDIAIWIYDRLVWPQQRKAPLPNPDLPPDIQADYEEAGAILSLSPRGSAALLRLGIQKLCKHLGGKGENINDDVALLVKNGLPKQVQQALDSIRVIGNEAVHPGQIDLRDDSQTAERLFELVNIIADVMISQPKKVSEIYNKLPQSKIKAIEQRDSK